MSGPPNTAVQATADAHLSQSSACSHRCASAAPGDQRYAGRWPLRPALDKCYLPG